MFVLVDHQVELVEVTVNKAVLCEANNHLYKLVIDFLGVNKTLDVHHRVGLNEAHDYAMAVCIIRYRSWEIAFIQSLHESILLERGDTGHVEPALGCSSLEVVAVVFDSAE